MELAKVKEQQQKREHPTEESWVWPDVYYANTDGRKRKLDLDRAIARGIEPEENEIRLKLWEKRYGVRDGVDEFLATWLNLNFFATVVKTDKKVKWHRKERDAVIRSLCSDIVQEYGGQAEHLLYLEFYHTTDFYFNMCKTDKKYSGLILGLGNMNSDRLAEKIAKEVFQVLRKVPPMFREISEYRILEKAAVDCFVARMPNQEVLLRHMLENPDNF